MQIKVFCKKFVFEVLEKYLCFQIIYLVQNMYIIAPPTNPTTIKFSKKICFIEIMSENYFVLSDSLCQTVQSPNIIAPILGGKVAINTRKLLVSASLWVSISSGIGISHSMKYIYRYGYDLIFRYCQTPG